jgi:hypothetical protein
MAEYENIFTRVGNAVFGTERDVKPGRPPFDKPPPSDDAERTADEKKPNLRSRTGGDTPKRPPSFEGSPVIDTQPPVTGFQPSSRLGGPSEDAPPGPGPLIHGAASQPPSPNLTGPSQDTVPADRRVHGAASQEPSPNLNARHPGFPTYEQLHPVDRAGAAGSTWAIHTRHSSRILRRVTTPGPSAAPTRISTRRSSRLRLRLRAGSRSYPGG